MRREPRPFTTAFKGRRPQSGVNLRPARPPVMGDFTDDTVMSSSGFEDDLPSRDVNEDIRDGGYEAALKAADRLFGKSTDEAVPPKNNLPALIQAVAPPKSQAILTAETFFKDPAATTLPALIEPPALSGRILPTLNERDELAERIASAEGRRRGRKPGSKNKVRSENALVAVGNEPKRRGRKPGSKNKPKVLPLLALAAPVLETAAQFQSELVMDVSPATALLIQPIFRRGRNKAKFKPWEGWKQRRLRHLRSA